jgi:thiamine biosynthesis lipoprotein
VTTDVCTRTEVLMGTVVTIQVVGQGTAVPEGGRDAAIDRAFRWFTQIESCCSRFDSRSELRQLIAHVGVPVPVSTMLFEAVQFALAVAADSGGAFDPTVGASMEARGFTREYRTGEAVRTAGDVPADVTYRDVQVDADRRTVTLLRPLVLDLGAVAKGLAIDMAARELQAFRDYAIDAGGDLYLAGHNPAGEPWSVGIRHPRLDRHVIESIRVSDTAVCTSGDYERRTADDAAHHILDPRTGASAEGAASVTVVAPSAMLADALATAAFVLGPEAGLRLLERHGVDGVILSPALERRATRGLAGV